MGSKLDPLYTGPYTVAEVLDKGRYCLEKADGTRLKKLYNGVLLKEKLDPVDIPEETTPATQPTKRCRQSSNPAAKRRKV